MSSSNRVPFQDITNRQIKDPRELKRQRDRERYAKNKDEILKRRHQLRELKKQSTAPVNDENTLHDTDDIGESVLTNIQFRATEEVLNLQLLGDLYLQHIGLFPTNHVTRTTLAELKMFKVFSQLIIYPFVFT